MDTQYIHPNNTYIVSSGFSDGQLIRYQYYNDLDSALADAGAGTLIVSYDLQSTFTEKTGVEVRFVRDMPTDTNDGKWCTVAIRIEYDGENIEGTIVANDTGLPLSNYVSAYNPNIIMFPRNATGVSLYSPAVGYDPSIYPVPILCEANPITVIWSSPVMHIVQGASNGTGMVILNADYTEDTLGENFPVYSPVMIVMRVYFTGAQLAVIRGGFD